MSTQHSTTSTVNQFHQDVSEFFDKDFHRPANNESAVLDIYLGSFLHALGYKIEYAKSTSYQSTFYFKDVPSGVILQYFNDSEVDGLTARKLFSSFQEMRRLSRQVRMIPAPTTVAEAERAAEDAIDTE